MNGLTASTRCRLLLMKITVHQDDEGMLSCHVRFLPDCALFAVRSLGLVGAFQAGVSAWRMLGEASMTQLFHKAC